MATVILNVCSDGSVHVVAIEDVETTEQMLEAIRILRQIHLLPEE